MLMMNDKQNQNHVQAGRRSNSGSGKKVNNIPNLVSAHGQKLMKEMEESGGTYQGVVDARRASQGKDQKQGGFLNMNLANYKPTLGAGVGLGFMGGS